MNQTTRTKLRKQQLQSINHNHNHNNNSNHPYSSGNGSASGTSRSPQQPQSYIVKLLFHISTVTNMVTQRFGIQQPHSQNQLLTRLGGLCLTLLTIYFVSSTILIYTHSFHNRNGTIIAQQQQQVTTPLYLTNSEQDIVSRILGIDHKTYMATITTQQRQSKQCTSSVNIRIPPTTLRKGKSQFVTEVEYQNQAVQLVHNIRVLMGMATQLGLRQPPIWNQPMDELLMGNTTSNTTSGTRISSLPLPLPVSTTQLPQNQQYKSFDNAVIMDYGCGPGRLLIGLLSANVCFTKYIGVDVNSKDIQWLTETYIDNTDGSNKNKKKNEPQKLVLTGTQKLQLHRQHGTTMRYLDQNGIYHELDQDLFQFIRVDVKNERYNKSGQKLDTDSSEKKERIVFPSIELHDELVNTVDIMILRSVFSHMLASDIYHHLRTLHSILKPNTGIMIVSLFLNTIPDSPVETVTTKETQQRGNHLVYISKQVFETILYETGYSIVLYLSQWNMGEDVYVLSSNGNKPPSPIFEENDDVKVDGADEVLQPEDQAVGDG